ncbi:MAG: hypothetical protein ACRDVG_06115, partial [Jatrophihabitantaceae bacterium]
MIKHGWLVATIVAIATIAPTPRAAGAATGCSVDGQSASQGVEISGFCTSTTSGNEQSDLASDPSRAQTRT